VYLPSFFAEKTDFFIIIPKQQGFILFTF